MSSSNMVCVYVVHFRNRLFSKITLFKLSQLTFSSAGMLVHTYKPLVKSIYDCTLIPAVLGGYSLISIILLLSYLCFQQKLISVYMIVSVSAIPLFLWTISALMDTIPRESAVTWTILLIKTSFCILALIAHSAEMLYFYITDEPITKNVPIRARQTFA